MPDFLYILLNRWRMRQFDNLLVKLHEAGMVDIWIDDKGTKFHITEEGKRVLQENYEI